MLYPPVSRPKKGTVTSEKKYIYILERQSLISAYQMPIFVVLLDYVAYKHPFRDDKKKKLRVKFMDKSLNVKPGGSIAPPCPLKAAPLFRIGQYVPRSFICPAAHSTCGHRTASLGQDSIPSLLHIKKERKKIKTPGIEPRSSFCFKISALPLSHEVSADLSV